MVADRISPSLHSDGDGGCRLAGWKIIGVWEPELWWCERVVLDKSEQQEKSDRGFRREGRGRLSYYDTSPHVLQSRTPAIASMTQANSRSPNDFTMSFIVNLLRERKSQSTVRLSKAGACTEMLIFGLIDLGRR